MHEGKQAKVASQKDVNYLWKIGYRSTLIAFVLWVVSALVFVVAMWTRFKGSFSSIEALHFFFTASLRWSRLDLSLFRHDALVVDGLLPQSHCTGNVRP